MLPDKEVKKKFKLEAGKNPDSYYATTILKREGYHRNQCKCGTFFWDQDENAKICGDPACSGGFRFFKNNPVKEKMDYIQTWQKLSKFFDKRGYKPIERYPVAARWRDDTDFVQASIYDFQPLVVTGEVDPPAKMLVVPQLCLRFNDIDNVGITMSHNTCFDMIGQHVFVSKDEWDQDKYFEDLLLWFTEGMGIPKDELTFHEDAWAGGGNYGPCMEFFSRGLELCNQVYTMFEQTPEGDKELQLKVLDMGLGHERVAWFAKGEGTQYDATFPTVMKKLLEATEVKYDKDFIQKYVPNAAYLNLDEVEDIDEAWERTAKGMGTSVKELREKIIPLSALYSVAEHSRTLLVALSDGALPGNVKGGYNLRTIYRRAQSFIDRNNWDIEMSEICKWHAEYLKPMYPELSKNLDEVEKILKVEKKKYEETKKRNKSLVTRLVEQGNLKIEKLIELYDSQGIDPEEVRKEAKKLGKKIDIPDNFYALVAERHEKIEQKTQTRKDLGIKLDDLEPTKILYYDAYDYIDFKGIVASVQGKYVILEKTAFYPTSGGQEHDHGTIKGINVVNIVKQGKIVVHELEKEPDFNKGDVVECKIDWERRLQLAQHHTATHIIGGVARKILGDHVWQGGAAKTQEKSRLDITHYENLTEEEVRKIEEEANKIVHDNIPVLKDFFRRDLAEKEYGFKIYQGGAAPDKEIRIINIKGLDVQACGGTHLNTTGEAEDIKILKTSKIQDGIVRIEFAAGAAAKKMMKHELTIVEDVAKLLDCDSNQIPGRANELFKKWKKAKKASKKGQKLGEADFKLTSTTPFEGDILQETAEILRTQPEHIKKTIERFKKELEKY